jgi:hypothetical protein
MGLKGNLESFFLTSILQLLHTEKKTGTLHVRNDNDEVRVILQEGNIIYAMSSNKEARLGNFLRIKGAVSLEQLEICLSEGKQKKQALGKVLVEKGLINADQLKRFIQIQVEEIIYGLFLWEKGEFFYTEAKLDLSGLVVIQLDMTKMILEAARRIDEMSVLKKQIPDPGMVYIMSKKASDREAIKFAGNERDILDMIDGRRTVDDLIIESGFSRFDVYKILYSLISAGLIVKKTEPPQTLPEEFTEEDGYIAIITGYTHILQIVWKNLEPEIGKEIFVLFDECKPEVLPGQIDLFKIFDPTHSISSNISILEENLKPGTNLKNERLFLIETFNRFVLGILNRTPDILGTLRTQKMLEEIEQVLPIFSRDMKELNINNSIVEDIKKIMDPVVEQIIEKEKRKDRTPGLVSMFKKGAASPS